MTKLKYSDAELIVWTDFDGTITLSDSNDFMTDNFGLGPEKRKKMGQDVFDGKVTFRDSFAKQMESVKQDWQSCKNALCNNIKLDPGFTEFYKYCKEEKIPVVILSSGMEEIIRSLLSHLMGNLADDIEILSNKADVHEDGSWDLVYTDDSDFGHDKSRAIKPYTSLPPEEKPYMIYCGDGVSDLSAARETDELLVRDVGDLINYCKKHNISYVPFKSFTDVEEIVRKKLKEIRSNRVGKEVKQQNGTKCSVN